MTDVIRANRQLAEKPCLACGELVLLGQEVVLSPKCGALHHRNCWEQRGDCASAACAQPAPEPAVVLPPAAAPPPGPTRPCPACGEPIPVGAQVCPHCAEPVGARSRIPQSFTVKRGTRIWTFAYTPDLLVGRGLGADEVRVPRDRAATYITLKKRKMTILDDAGKKWRFATTPLAYVLVDYWMTGTLKPRTSSKAWDALAMCLLGLIVTRLWLLTVIVEIVAFYQAIQADKEIREHPELLKGRGVTITTIVLSIIFFVLGIGAYFARMAQIH